MKLKEKGKKKKKKKKGKYAEARVGWLTMCAVKI